MNAGRHILRVLVVASTVILLSLLVRVLLFGERRTADRYEVPPNFTGMWCTWNRATGKKASEGRYERGLKTGAHKRWNWHGRLVELVHYEGGQQHGQEKGWWNSGILASERYWVNGQPHGVWMAYDRNHMPMVRRCYKHGTPCGEWMFWDSGGQIVGVSKFDDDGSGRLTEYYPSGHVKEVGMYVKGKREGEFINYHESGDVASIVHYKAGELAEAWVSEFSELYALSDEGGLIRRGMRRNEKEQYRQLYGVTRDSDGKLLTVEVRHYYEGKEVSNEELWRLLRNAPEGKRHGQWFEAARDAEGNLLSFEAKWYLDGKQVTEEEFARRKKRNPRDESGAPALDEADLE